MNLPPSATEQLRQGILVITGDQRGQTADTDSQLLALMLHRWWLIALLALAVAAVAVVYCLMTPRFYRAQVLMEAVQPEAATSNLGSLSGLASLAGVDLGNDTVKKEFVARITSRAFTYRFMTDEGIIPILFSDKWDAANRRWKSAADQPSLEKAYRLFGGSVRTVSEDRRNGFIRVTVDWKDPELAQDWANKLVARFNADSRELARDEAQRNLEFLNRALTHTDVVDLRTTINSLIENETRKSMLATVREQYAFKIIDPAFLPGKEGIVWPRPALLTAVGLLSGAVLGMLVVLVLAPRESKWRANV